jgi:hypothetical protein
MTTNLRSKKVGCMGFARNSLLTDKVKQYSWWFYVLSLHKYQSKTGPENSILKHELRATHMIVYTRVTGFNNP